MGLGVQGKPKRRRGRWLPYLMQDIGSHGTIFPMPSVSRLSIAPVKSLGLVHPREVSLERHGAAENRRFYLIDAHGRLFNGVAYGPLVQVEARCDSPGERLSLGFPDGALVEGEVELGEPVDTDFYGRRVLGRIVAGPWAEALSDYAGAPLRLVRTERPGAACDVHAATLVSGASLEELRRRAGRTEPVDSRRFRMLIEIDGCAPHAEDTWRDRRVRAGEAVLRVRSAVARCAVTTQDPATGIPDLDTLRVIKSYRGLREGRKIDFGVYADVEEPGLVRVGDPVEPE